MLLEGSCHCGSIRFRVESSTPYPYQACYCSICRKTAGGGGYAINLGADAGTLEVEGGENLAVYAANSQDRGAPERNFCRICGSYLWLFNPMWPDLVHPFASAIDTPLPKPPERVRIMLDHAAPWWGGGPPRRGGGGTSPSTRKNLWKIGTAATGCRSQFSGFRLRPLRAPKRKAIRVV